MAGRAGTGILFLFFMLTLAVNTASKQITIAVLKGLSLWASASWESRADETEKLLSGISKLLQKARIQFSKLDRVAVCCGPGSFSALRIGVTVANTLAFVLKIPLYECKPEYWKFPLRAHQLRKIKIGIPKYSLPPNITQPKARET